MTTRLPSPLGIVCLSAGSGDGLTTGAVVFDVLTAEPSASAETGPAWIKLAPRGRFKTRDDRSYDVNPEALVARFQADGIDVPIDIDHATAKKVIFGDAAPAIGWIKELSARTEGLYARVEWLQAGRTALMARTHRYVSPGFKADDAGVVQWIHSAALVAAPALAMPAVASADPKQQEQTMLKKIAVALGLTETADEPACLSAIATFASRVDKAVHDQTLATLSSTTAELTALKEADRTAKVRTLLDGALEAKKILPAQRDHYQALCATDEGLASVTKLIEATAAGLAASGLDGRKPEDSITALSAAQAAAAKVLGVSPEDYLKTLAAERTSSAAA